MNKWFLLSCFPVLVFFALLLVIYPLRARSRKSLLLLVPLLISAIVLMYSYSGSWRQWQAHQQQQARQQEIKRALASVKSTDELIEKLKARLDDNPQSARGWYLLGRLYASQNNWQPARDAFAKALRLKPGDEASTVNYAQSLWQLDKQQLSPAVAKLLQQILLQNPVQPDALAMLAMGAYNQQHFAEAAAYWQRLLKLVPGDSEEAQVLRKAIARASSQAN